MKKQISPETQRLIEAIPAFAKLMEQRLREKDGKYTGWEDYDPHECADQIEQRLPKLREDHAKSIGIANWSLISYVNSITVKPEDQL